jgi:hypothetical protein
MLAGDGSDASIVMLDEEISEEKEDKDKKVAINLNKNFDQIMVL